MEDTVQGKDNSVLNKTLFGTLSIEGGETFYAYLKQSRQMTTWVLTTQENEIKSVIRSKSTGKLYGYGNTVILSRLLDNIAYLVGRAEVTDMGSLFRGMKGEYNDTIDGSFIRYTTHLSTSAYNDIEMAYEGFKLDMHPFTGALAFKLPKDLYPIESERSKNVSIACLGVTSFASLKRKFKDALDWFNSKDYRMIETNDDFRTMMGEFLDYVQEASLRNEAVLVGLDTETTGLNMRDLDVNNPMRDRVVAIPFAWRDNVAYLINIDMHYFGNVDREEVFPLFTTLFCRNKDYSYQDIDIVYNGKHYHFNRRHILVTGANAGFDMCAFFSEGSDVFFDEDIQIVHYNIATDWAQGKNSLKYMTHRYLGVQTLELEDLFGNKHKDKFRYLADRTLALIYGGADGDFTRLVFKYLYKMLEPKLYMLYKKYDITTLYRTARATWRGMHVDDRRVREQGEQVRKDIETLQNLIYSFAYAANREALEDKSSRLTSICGIERIALDNGSIGDEEGMYRYPFTPANHKHLLYNVLGYPVYKVSDKSGEPALDKFVLGKLVAQKLDTPSGILKEDIQSAVPGAKPLIEAAEFNKCKYPLAMVFQKYAAVNKEWTSYYKPIADNDMESRMFYTFSLQRAATRRILSAGQTMKSDLKRLVTAPSGRMIMCFDASQIEYRHMASMAYIRTKAIMQQKYPNDWESRLNSSNIARVFNLMHNPEADYHIETAAMMTGKPQYMIDHDTRKIYKSIGFGIPYGLGDRSMCESLFKAINDETMSKTKQLLQDYKTKNSEIIGLLESTRDDAFRPVDASSELRTMLDLGRKNISLVRNFVGFYRLFILEERITRERVGRIRRQAGNCLIQGGAAEIYRRMLYGFHQGCCEAGIDNMVEWLMLVHDELDTSISTGVDVCKLIDVLQTNCTLRYPEHIPYFIGIGFGDNWYDAKSDSAELPVIMVDRLVEAYRNGKFFIPSDGNQAQNLLNLKRHYMCDRVYEILRDIIPNLGPGFVWDDGSVAKVNDEFTNYVVRAYLDVFATKEDKKKYDKKIPLGLKLQRWQAERERYGFDFDFLKTTIEDSREALRNLSLDSALNSMDLEGIGAPDVFQLSADDLQIELMDDSNEDEDLGFQMDKQRASWFDESALKDSIHSSNEDDEEDTEGGEGYRYIRDSEDEEDTYEINSEATNPFDLFVSKHYVRKRVFKLKEGTFSISLQGTSFNDNPSLLSAVIKKTFSVGTDTIILVGKKVCKVEGISCVSEHLDNLDKLIDGVIDT